METKLKRRARGWVEQVSSPGNVFQLSSWGLSRLFTAARRHGDMTLHM